MKLILGGPTSAAESSNVFRLSTKPRSFMALMENPSFQFQSTPEKSSFAQKYLQGLYSTTNPSVKKHFKLFNSILPIFDSELVQVIKKQKCVFSCLNLIKDHP